VTAPISCRHSSANLTSERVFVPRDGRLPPEASGGRLAPQHQRGEEAMSGNWKAWAIPVGTSAILALGAITVLAIYTIVYRIPDVEKRMDRLDTDLRDQLKSMTLQLVGVRVNVLRLCAQKNSLATPCKVEELVSEAKSVSRFQAQFFSDATVSLVAGWHEPQVTSEYVRQRLPRWPGSFGSQTVAKAGIADLIMWSSAADSATWHEKAGNVVEVRFTNGSASFELTPKSEGYASQLVSYLNATVDALHTVVGGDAVTEK
jgi:hypothetical protein